MGVNTPIAAEVAATTVGFAMDWHIPNGMIFIIGLLSMMFAAGWPPIITLLSGNTIKEDGAKPKLHFNIAPLQTNCDMNQTF
jgi:hypothetical protein